MSNKKKYISFNNNKNIGLFVANPLYINLSSDDRYNYIRNIRNS